MSKFPRSPIHIESLVKISCTEMWRESEGTREIKHPALQTGKAGIYEIRNLQQPGKYYIGMSRDLERRKWRHFNDLKTGKHLGEMQKDYNDFCHEDRPEFHPVEELFEFRVIAFCRPSELTFYENLLIKYLNPYYNTHKEKPLWENEEKADEEMGEIQGFKPMRVETPTHYERLYNGNELRKVGRDGFLK